MDGRSIRARSVKIGDTIMNEWNNHILKVVNIRHIHYGRHHDIQLHCTREDGRGETISGRYWTGKTWLVKRG